MRLEYYIIIIKLLINFSILRLKCCNLRKGYFRNKDGIDMLNFICFCVLCIVEGYKVVIFLIFLVL